jgi:hypothetical protein
VLQILLLLCILCGVLNFFSLFPWLTSREASAGGGGGCDGRGIKILETSREDDVRAWYFGFKIISISCIKIISIYSSSS